MSEQDRHAMLIRADARAMSAVTALDVRVSERWKPTARHAIGTAFDSNGPVLTETGGATVKVTKDGITEYVPASQFRTKREKQHTRSRKPSVQYKRAILAEAIHSRYQHNFND